MNIHAATWEAIKAIMLSDRQDAVDALIQKEDPEARARIKVIDEMLDRYPLELAAQKD